MSNIATTWTPKVNMLELEDYLENAYRRAMGSVRYDIDMDRVRLSSLKDSASGALDAGLNQTGPLLARMGRGLAAAGSFRPGPGLALQDIAGEILHEFYAEASTAFSKMQVSLGTQATEWLKGQNRDEASIHTILEAAGHSYMMPDKEQFTREAAPFINEGLSTMGNTVLGAIAGLALGVAFFRSVHLGILLAVVCGGAGWYQGRQRTRAKAHRLVLHLPRVLAQMLLNQWNTNVRRFADVVNAR